MPAIIGLTTHQLSKMPNEILEANIFKYRTADGILCVRDQGYEIPRSHDDNLYGMYEHYSVIFEYGRPIGYFNGEYEYARKFNRDKLVIDGPLNDITQQELTMYKDLIFYNEASYIAAMEYF